MWICWLSVLNPRSRVERLAAETPATFVAFDLLAEDDEYFLVAGVRIRTCSFEL